MQTRKIKFIWRKKRTNKQKQLTSEFLSLCGFLLGRQEVSRGYGFLLGKLLKITPAVLNGPLKLLTSTLDGGFLKRRAKQNTRDVRTGRKAVARIQGGD